MREKGECKLERKKIWEREAKGRNVLSSVLLFLPFLSAFVGTR